MPHSFVRGRILLPGRGIWEMPKGREGDRGLWHPSSSQQLPVTRASWKRAEAKSLCSTLEGRDQYQERKRKLAATAVVFTTSGVTFISLQDLSLSRDQTEKGNVKLCQKRREEEEGERRTGHPLRRTWERTSNAPGWPVCESSSERRPRSRVFVNCFLFKVYKTLIF